LSYRANKQTIRHDFYNKVVGYINRVHVKLALCRIVSHAEVGLRRKFKGYDYIRLIELFCMSFLPRDAL